MGLAGRLLVPEGRWTLVRLARLPLPWNLFWRLRWRFLFGLPLVGPPLGVGGRAIIEEGGEEQGELYSRVGVVSGETGALCVIGFALVFERSAEELLSLFNGHVWIDARHVLGHFSVSHLLLKEICPLATHVSEKQ